MKRLRRFKLLNKDFSLILVIYLVFQSINFLIISLSPNFLKSQDQVILPNIPRFLSVLSNFDGVHYIFIVNNGYGVSEQAFFPLFPILVSIVHKISSYQTIYAGLIVSNVCFILALYFLYKVFQSFLSKSQALWSLLFLVFFPTSFFFISFYTESTFLLLLALSTFFLLKKRPFLSAMAGYFLGLTRIQGFFSFFIYWFNYKELRFKSLIPVIAPILGFLTYAYYLFQTKGNFLYFLTVQGSFGSNRSSHFILLPQVFFRYIKIFLDKNWGLTHYVALSEFIVFNIVFFSLVFYLYKLYKERSEKTFNLQLGLLLFSFANILIPTLTGTLLSIPRFALLSISFFVILSNIKNKFLKILILVIFLFFHIILLALFNRGYFIG